MDPSRIGCPGSISAFSGLPASPSGPAPRRAWGMMTRLATVVGNEAFGSFSLKRKPVAGLLDRSDVVENGLNIGDLSPIVAWKEKITSSTVTGCRRGRSCRSGAQRRAWWDRPR